MEPVNDDKRGKTNVGMGNKMTLKDQVWQTLKSISYPGYSRDLVSFGLVSRVAECDGLVTISLVVGNLAPDVQQTIISLVRARVEQEPGVKKLNIEVGAPQVANPRAAPAPVAPASISHIIAVGSGKGGVGKSTVAVNLAVAMAQQGLRVGLIDADVYGPNVPRMLGVESLPPPQDGKITPAEVYGVRVVSIAFLVPADKPVIWRGPLTDKLIRQFLTDVAWGELDVLVVDLPPGTGDIALSLIQHAQPSGAIVVATPQEVALDDARKAVAMFQQLKVPVLGVVENMSYFECDDCHKQHDLFGHGGGERFSHELRLPLLGMLPLEPSVRAGGDSGRPAALQKNSQAGAELRKIADRIWQTLAQPEPLLEAA